MLAVTLFQGKEAAGLATDAQTRHLTRPQVPAAATLG